MLLLAVSGLPVLVILATATTSSVGAPARTLLLHSIGRNRRSPTEKSQGQADIFDTQLKHTQIGKILLDHVHE